MFLYISESSFLWINTKSKISKNFDIKREYGLELKENYNLDEYDAVVLSVAHNEFKEISSKISKLKTQNSKLIIYDIKGFFDKNLVDGRL